mgnify:CR=1 FL=1
MIKIIFFFYILLFNLLTLNASNIGEAIKNLNEKKYTLALDQFTQLALDDNINAQYNLGLMNYKGLGTNIDKKLASIDSVPIYFFILCYFF